MVHNSFRRLLCRGAEGRLRMLADTMRRNILPSYTISIVLQNKVHARRLQSIIILSHCHGLCIPLPSQTPCNGHASLIDLALVSSKTQLAPPSSKCMQTIMALNSFVYKVETLRDRQVSTHRTCIDTYLFVIPKTIWR